MSTGTITVTSLVLRVNAQPGPRCHRAVIRCSIVTISGGNGTWQPGAALVFPELRARAGANTRAPRQLQQQESHGTGAFWSFLELLGCPFPIVDV